MIDVATFKASSPGPRLLILGAVHGNEICGPAAISIAIAACEKGDIKLKRGQVTLIPVCNPQAYKEDKRFIDHNLNRNFGRKESPRVYEEKLMNEIAPHLENCDVLLDIHSYRAGGPAFAFRGPDRLKEREEAFAAALGISHVIYGWDDAYRACGVAIEEERSVGTTEYARRRGAIALTLECGQHRDLQAVPVASRGIEGVLHFCDLVDGKGPSPTENLKRTRLKKMFFKEREGRFSQAWKHLQEVKQGELLAQMEDNSTITAPFDGRIVLPHEEAPIGQEWLYMGVDES
jgi:predicted deacylase